MRTLLRFWAALVLHCYGIFFTTSALGINQMPISNDDLPLFSPKWFESNENLNKRINIEFKNKFDLNQTKIIFEKSKFSCANFVIKNNNIDVKKFMQNFSGSIKYNYLLDEKNSLNNNLNTFNISNALIDSSIGYMDCGYSFKNWFLFWKMLRVRVYFNVENVSSFVIAEYYRKNL